MQMLAMLVFGEWI